MDIKQLTSQINFKVISKQVRNLQKILHTVSYAVLASYNPTTTMWTYLKYKGPLFLIQDKLHQKKLVLLNQCSLKDYIQPIHQSFIFELKDLGSNGFMINFLVDDSICGLTIKGIWSQDQNIRDMYQTLIQKLN